MRTNHHNPVTPPLLVWLLTLDMCIMTLDDISCVCVTVQERSSNDSGEGKPVGKKGGGGVRSITVVSKFQMSSIGKKKFPLMTWKGHRCCPECFPEVSLMTIMTQPGWSLVNREEGKNSQSTWHHSWKVNRTLWSANNRLLMSFKQLSYFLIHSCWECVVFSWTCFVLF